FDLYYEQEHLRHQLLGSTPSPQGRDPREYAAEAAEPRFANLDYASLDVEARRLRTQDIQRAAADWQLLLEVSVADFLQANVEGTVYFLMHRADLAAWDFARVAIVYQLP